MYVYSEVNNRMLYTESDAVHTCTYMNVQDVSIHVVALCILFFPLCIDHCFIVTQIHCLLYALTQTLKGLVGGVLTQ